MIFCDKKIDSQTIPYKMKSTCVCRTVCAKSGGKHIPHGALQKPWKTYIICKIRLGKNIFVLQLLEIRWKPLVKQHFRVMGKKHTSVPSVARTVGSVGNHWKTISKTSNSLRNHTALTFRGRRRIYTCYSYRKTLGNRWEIMFSVWQGATENPLLACPNKYFLHLSYLHCAIADSGRQNTNPAKFSKNG